MNKLILFIVKPNVAGVAATPLSVWTCFFSNDIINLIVTSTNKGMKAKVDLVIGNKAFYYVAYTNDTEILAFIGLLCMRGWLQLNHLNYQCCSVIKFVLLFSLQQCRLTDSCFPLSTYRYSYEKPM